MFSDVSAELSVKKSSYGILQEIRWALIRI